MISSACCGEIKAGGLLELEALRDRQARAARVSRHGLEAVGARLEALALELAEVEAPRPLGVCALECLAHQHVAGALLRSRRRLLRRLHAVLAALDPGRRLLDRERGLGGGVQ